MKKEFKRVIFNSDSYSYEDAKMYLIEDQGIENPSDDEIWDEINFCNNLAIKDERFEFAIRDKNINGPIIVIADVGRWNGRRTGVKRFNHFEEIIDFMTHYDSFEIYIDKYDLRGVGHHHDGTDFLMFRMVPEMFNWDTVEYNILSNVETERVTKYYTRSLRKFLKGYIY